MLSETASNAASQSGLADIATCTSSSLLPSLLSSFLHRRRRRRGQHPQYLTCRGPSMCWTPIITPTQSCIQRTIFSLKSAGPVIKTNARQQCPEMLYFCLRMHQNAVGGRWVSLLRSSSPLSWIKEERKRRRWGKKEEGKGRPPQYLKCVWRPCISPFTFINNNSTTQKKEATSFRVHKESTARCKKV